MTNPVIAEVWRGGIVESRHRGAICIVGPGGTTLFESGDIDQDVYPRSAIKIFQALPLIESGAADAFGFGQPALALACASHNGEARHTDQAAAMLADCGCDAGTLECGAHDPRDRDVLRQLAIEGRAASAIHNNCSGKHAGMIATAMHLGEDPAHYVDQEHPVQQRIRATMSELTDTLLENAPCAIDGCSVPTWALPLNKTALGLSRLVTGEGPGADHKDAAARLMAACIAEPEMTSGIGRNCAHVMRASRGRAYVKTGAEGVYCGAVPERGIGIALKIDDGHSRASEVTIAAVVSALLPDTADALAPWRNIRLRNWRQFDVGELRPSAALMTVLAAIP